MKVERKKTSKRFTFYPVCGYHVIYETVNGSEVCFLNKVPDPIVELVVDALNAYHSQDVIHVELSLAEAREVIENGFELDDALEAALKS